MRTREIIQSALIKTAIVIFLCISLIGFLCEQLKNYISEWENSLPLEDIIKLHSLEAAPEGYVSLGKFKLTAYCPCEICCGKWGKDRPSDQNGVIVITASGDRAIEGITVAADTDLLSFGTKLRFGEGEYIVQDRGSAIKNKSIDVYFDDHHEAKKFGVQYKRVYMKFSE